MSLNLASLNVRGLRDPSKCARLLGKLSNLCVNFAEVQETHFICADDYRLLENEFLVLSAFSNRCSAGVSLLTGHSFKAIVNLVFADDGSRLVVVDVTIRSYLF